MIRYATFHAAGRREKLTTASNGFPMAEYVTKRMRRASVVKEGIGKRMCWLMQRAWRIWDDGGRERNAMWGTTLVQRLLWTAADGVPWP